MSDVYWTMIQRLQTFYSGPIHVKISQTLGVREEYMQQGQVFTGICGPLLASYCHASSSWRTLQRTLFEEDEKWLGHLPNWGMIVNGELYEVAVPLALPIEENAYSSLPTPCASDAWNTRDSRKRFNRVGTIHYNEKKANNPACQNLHTAVHMMEPTGQDTRLHPNFVEWMMGLPIGWTELDL